MAKKISKLRFDNFFVRRRPKSLNDLNNEYELNLSLVVYMRLHEALQLANERHNDEEKPVQSMEFFIKSFTKGSKPFRRILNDSEFKKLQIEKVNTVTSFFGIIDMEMVDRKNLRHCWGEWQKNYYGNKCREFLYKFRNNVLGTNDRVSKFVPGHNSECSLCIFNKEPLPIQSESFTHVFFTVYIPVSTVRL
jgi:hypothetical protein